MKTQLARTLYFSLQYLRREPIREALYDLSRTEFLSLEALKHLQASRMITHLQFAFANIPFYQNNYRPFSSRIHNLSNWDDVNDLMNELPCVTKDDVQKDSAQFTTRNIQKMRTYPDKTSGSTGTPLVFPCNQRAWAYRHALVFRAMSMFDVHIGEPYALFFGLHWNRNSRNQIILRDWVFNRVRVSAFDIGRETFESYLKKVRNHHPSFFLGYPSAIYDFCYLAHEFGIDLRELKLKAIFTTAEPLWSYQREMIEDITGSRCVNHYGSAEGGFTAFECPQGNMHLAIETAWLRLRDTSASSGEALVTDMMLRTFPLINYAIEDEVTLKEGTCACGRFHPLIESINGRSGEPILLPNGKRINANLPSYIFKPLAALKIIQRYRFVLQGKDLKLYLIVSDKFTDDHMRIVEQETKAAFGSDIQFSTHLVSKMEVLPNAKHKSFVVIPENVA